MSINNIKRRQLISEIGLVPAQNLITDINGISNLIGFKTDKITGRVAVIRQDKLTVGIVLSTYKQ